MRVSKVKVHNPDEILLLQVLTEKLQSFSLNQIEENVVVLSIIERVLSPNFRVNQERQNCLNYIKVQVLLQLIKAVKQIDELICDLSKSKDYGDCYFYVIKCITKQLRSGIDADCLETEVLNKFIPMLVGG